eukprot:GGOE01022395.1.p1 GENE.GGOE01022395.1~~GGOE01022395.1.p1  ORF type:complete len:485 (-),score=70.10 GGOE01022395.1:97-1356(-)
MAKLENSSTVARQGAPVIARKPAILLKSGMARSNASLASQFGVSQLEETLRSHFAKHCRAASRPHPRLEAVQRFAARQQAQADCSRLLVWRPWGAGLGSNLRMLVQALGTAVWHGRPFVEPQYSTYYANPATCQSQTHFGCYFRPIHNCSAPPPSAVCSLRELRMRNCGAGDSRNPRCVSRKASRWWQTAGAGPSFASLAKRLQVPLALLDKELLQWVMRPNNRLATTIAHHRHRLGLSKPYISIFVRSGSRFRAADESGHQLPNASSVARLARAVAGLLQVSVVFLSTDDPVLSSDIATALAASDLKPAQIPHDAFPSSAAVPGQCMEDFLPEFYTNHSGSLQDEGLQMLANMHLLAAGRAVLAIGSNRPPMHAGNVHNVLYGLLWRGGPAPCTWSHRGVVSVHYAPPLLTAVPPPVK